MKTVHFTQNEASLAVPRKIYETSDAIWNGGLWKVLEKPVRRKPRPLECRIGKCKTGMKESRDRQISLLEKTPTLAYDVN